MVPKEIASVPLKTMSPGVLQEPEELVEDGAAGSPADTGATQVLLVGLVHGGHVVATVHLPRGSAVRKSCGRRTRSRVNKRDNVYDLYGVDVALARRRVINNGTDTVGEPNGGNFRSWVKSLSRKLSSHSVGEAVSL